MSQASTHVQRLARAAYQAEWRTPPELFRRYDAEFGFTLDAAASPENALCARYLTVEDNALEYGWGRETVWLNPPYNALGAWMRKAWEASRAGATVVCLIPSRTCTRWWHEYVERAAERRFLRGRIRFVGAPGDAPFASVVVVFRPESRDA